MDDTDKIWKSFEAKIADADPAAGMAARKPRVSRRSAIAAGGIAAAVALAVGAAGTAGVVSATGPAGPVPAAPSSSLQIPMAAGLAANASKDSSSISAMRPYGYFSGASVFEPSSDVRDVPGTASGYVFTTRDVDFSALAGRLAEVFGVPGAPRREGAGWMVGAPDYSGANVYLSEDGVAGWSFNDPAQMVAPCAEPASPAVGAPVSEPLVSSGVAGATPGSGGADCAPGPEGKPLGAQEAQKQAQRVLQQIGVGDDSMTRLEWEAGGDDYATWVNAWQLVDGQRTSLAWSFSFGPDGIVSASGFAAAPERTADFPVVGARTAVLRSQQAKWSAFGPSPVYTNEGAAVSVSSDATEGGAPAAGEPAMPGRVQVVGDTVVVTDVAPTLVQYWQPDGTLLLLPGYLLSTAGGRGDFTVISVADTAVDFVSPPDVSAQPMPMGAAGISGAGGSLNAR